MDVDRLVGCWELCRFLAVAASKSQDFGAKLHDFGLWEQIFLIAGGS